MTIHRRDMAVAQTDISNSAFENIDFGTQAEAASGCATWNATNDNFVITADGVYLISATLQCDQAQWIVVRIAQDGTTNLTHNAARADQGYAFQYYAGGSADELPFTIATVADLLIDDTIDIQVKSSAGTGENVTGGTVTITQLVSGGSPPATRKVMVIS